MARTALVDSNNIVLSHGYVTFVPGPGERVEKVPEDFTFDRRTERFDATSPTKKRPATAEEIAAFEAARVDEEARLQVDSKILRAVITYFVQRLNELRTQPATAFPALTAQDVRSGVIAIYKALSG